MQQYQYLNNQKNQKTKSKTPLLLTILLLAGLTACSFDFNFQIGGLGSTTSFDVSYSNDNYYIPNSLKYTLRDVNSNLGWVTSETVGEQKFLVVPIQLKDAPSWSDTMLTNLNAAFFGNKEETNFESVKSFYETSSYGQLKIGGEVVDPVKVPFSVKELDRFSTSAPDLVINEFYSFYNSAKLKEYDTDSDGYIDNAIFIYSNDYSKNSTSAYWAWCYSYNAQPNINKPNVNNYMWASYAFTKENYLDLYRSTYVDAHTYIHETGHLLGLDDYYSYDTVDTWDPAGRLEMQSYNVGDHNIFSKLAMGWVKPYVPTGSTVINLKTSAKYPEAILLNTDWNGSAFDEYILIEYYTPTELNEVDSKHNFSGNGKMYDYSGLRIYHVDARIAKLRASNGMTTFMNYVDDMPSIFDGYYYYIGASNSACYSYLSDYEASRYRLIHLLDQGEFNKINDGKGGALVPGYTLWDGSKVFSPSSKFFINDNEFNDGSKIGFHVSVSDLNEESCTVTISYLD